jgi:hypothetical protein
MNVFFLGIKHKHEHKRLKHPIRRKPQRLGSPSHLGILINPYTSSNTPP